MKLKFQSRLFLLIVALVLSLLLMVLVIVQWQFENFSQDSLERSLLRTNKYFQEYLQSLSQYRVAEPCRNLAFAPRFIAAIAEQDSLTILQKAQEEHRNIESDLFIVTDNNGIPQTILFKDDILNSSDIIKMSTIINALNGETESDLIYFQNEIIQIASTPVYRGPYLAGTLSIGLIIDSEKAETIKEGTDSEITFLRQGRILASTIDDTMLPDLQHLAQISRAAPGLIQEMEVGGVPYLCYVGELNNLQNQQIGTYHIQVSMEESLQFLRSIEFILLSVGLIAILLALLLSYFVARTVTAPVAKLVQGANTLAAGHYDAEISVKRSDEIGYLAQAFNEMRISLKRAFKMEQALARIHEEMRLAFDIQTNLLPKEAPKISGYDIAGKSIPAMNVGGDYFDFIDFDEKQLAICVGDISGKGMSAALLMANLQATIRGQTLLHNSAAVCMKYANLLLHRNTENSRFATVFYGILDTEQHRFSYSNAGHNPPMLFSNNSSPQLLQKGGLVLGVMEDVMYEEETVLLREGDLLVLYSDGITEAMNGDDVEFGEERLRQTINKYRGVSSTDLVEKIIQDVQTHVAGASQSDDITIVIVQRQENDV